MARKLRRLGNEQLETRVMMAADAFAGATPPWIEPSGADTVRTARDFDAESVTARRFDLGDARQGGLRGAPQASPQTSLLQAQELLGQRSAARPLARGAFAANASGPAAGGAAHALIGAVREQVQDASAEGPVAGEQRDALRAAIQSADGQRGSRLDGSRLDAIRERMVERRKAWGEVRDLVEAAREDGEVTDEEREAIREAAREAFAELHERLDSSRLDAVRERLAERQEVWGEVRDLVEAAREDGEVTAEERDAIKEAARAAFAELHERPDGSRIDALRERIAERREVWGEVRDLVEAARDDGEVTEAERESIKEAIRAAFDQLHDDLDGGRLESLRERIVGRRGMLTPPRAAWR